uniref:HMG box domain-containing protein n=1 Tax=Anopheles epiroticus TaxID=199890 RepID=A0A182PBE0_9DIPT
MIQNSAYGNPMIDGAPVFPDLYIQHQTVEKPDVDDGPQPINNNVANYTNRNSGYRFQTCIASQPAPVVPRDGYIISEAGKDAPNTPMGLLAFSQNVRIKTDQCKEDTGKQADATNVPPMQTTGETIDKEGRNLLTVSRQPYEALQQSITYYVQTPAAAGEEREPEDEEVTHSHSPKKDQRRPMNAFLIFCKRHRTMLKNRFSEENRTISIKLGKWWRLLTTEQKKPFQQLSKEYKARYFSLNPNFRWSKPPAVRASSPANLPPATSTSSGLSLPVVQAASTFNVQDSRESLEAAESLVQLAQGACLLSTFRLADESKMGSLNELCVGTNVGGKADQAWKLQPKPNQPIEGEKSELTPATSSSGQAAPIAEQGRSSTRATRSCKGKLYKELMSRMFPSANAPQTKRRSSPTKVQKEQQKLQAPVGDDPREAVQLSEMNAHAIDALMLELDAKISDLPAMNLNEFCFTLNSEKKRKKSFSKLRKQKLLLRKTTELHTPAMPTASATLLQQSCSSSASTISPNATAVPSSNGLYNLLIASPNTRIKHTTYLGHNLHMHDHPAERSGY